MLLLGIQNRMATLEDRKFRTKLHTLLPYDPAVVLRGIYPKELKTSVLTKPWIQMFTAALFRLAQTGKQSRCLSVSAVWMNKPWCVQTLEYYSALTK